MESPNELVEGSYREDKDTRRDISDTAMRSLPETGQGKARDLLTSAQVAFDSEAMGAPSCVECELLSAPKRVAVAICTFSRKLTRITEKRSNPSALTRPVQRKTGLFSRPYLMFPNLYFCFVALSMIDLRLTCDLLATTPEAEEANPIAAATLFMGGLYGLIAYKTAMTVLNVTLMETVGRLCRRTGQQLALAAVIITACPVVWVIWQTISLSRI